MSGVDLGLQSGFGTGAWLYGPGMNYTSTTESIGPFRDGYRFADPQLTASPGDYSATADFGLGLSLLGVAMAATGAYWEAQAQKDQLEGQAKNLEFRDRMSLISARLAEEEAQTVLAAGHRAIFARTLQAGAEEGARRTRIAARGIIGGAGSAAEEIASGRLIKELDVLAIDTNTVRQASASRFRGVNLRAQGTLARATAANVRATAGSISPAIGGATTLLGGLGDLALRWDASRSRYVPAGV